MARFTPSIRFIRFCGKIYNMENIANIYSEPKIDYGYSSYHRICIINIDGSKHTLPQTFDTMHSANRYIKNSLKNNVITPSQSGPFKVENE